MKKIKAKFNSKCAETGATIKKGDLMYYDYRARQCYTLDSKTATNYENGDGAGGYVTANENAFYDNFCSTNNI